MKMMKITLFFGKNDSGCLCKALLKDLVIKVFFENVCLQQLRPADLIIFLDNINDERSMMTCHGICLSMFYTLILVRGDNIF